MNASEIENSIAEYLSASAGNYVPADRALRSDIAGMRIFDDPLVGVCAADDGCLLSYRNNEEANLHMLMPDEWIPGARSVVSVFLPFTERVRASNREEGTVSYEWLHGRIEGQACVVDLAEYLVGRMSGSIAPFMDARFRLERVSGADPTRMFTVNWSERHVAYAAGLGTFSMPGGLITKKGAAGRLFSVVTSYSVEPIPRSYSDVYEYCVRCGKCIGRCPVGAITRDMKKDALLCSERVNVPKEKLAPYYGCGKCQTAVPCEYAAPGLRKALPVRGRSADGQPLKNP
jgi:epoxyqueuosine reductase QueG